MADAHKIVLDMLAAWEKRDYDKIMSSFADDAVYHNIPVQPIEGKKAIGEIFRAFFELMDVSILEVVNSAANGNVVFTERVDRFRFAKTGQRLDLPVNGVFEVRDGKIVAFRDYFDLASFEKPSGMKL